MRFRLQLPRKQEDDERTRICWWRGLERQAPDFSNVRLKDLETFRFAHRFDVFSFILVLSACHVEAVGFSRLSCGEAVPSSGDVPLNDILVIHA